MEKNKKAEEKENRKRRFLIIIIFLLFLIAGLLLIFLLWGQDRTEPIAGNVPPEVREFLSQKDIDELKKVKFPVYFGLEPPNIEGTYYTNSTRVDYDKAEPSGINSKIVNYRRIFQNQTKDLGIVVNSTAANAPSSKGKGGFISGEGDCFTIYQKSVTYWGLGCTTTSADLISGCLDKNGNIKNFKTSIKMLDGCSEKLCKRLRDKGKRAPMPKDNIRVNSERDGLAEKIR